MKKVATYCILENLRIILEYYYGPTNLEDLISLRNKLRKETQLNHQFNFLVDLREADFDLSTDIVDGFIDHVKLNNQLIWKRKTAILTNTPNQAAFSNLYITHLGNVPIFVNEFNTLEGALKWIDSSIEILPFIERKIQELKVSVME
jgi:hypothetical protein